MATATASAVRADKEVQRDSAWINSWRDLERFGIRYLTGERCRLGRRILCDVTEEGAALLKQVLDVPELTLMKPWNSGAIGAFMCPTRILQDLALFGLIREGWETVYIFGESMCGASGETRREYEEAIGREMSSKHKRFEETGTWPKGGMYDDVRVYQNPRSLNHVHAMTGRG